ITKLGAAVAQGVVTVVYLIIGVTNYTNQISDVENQASLGEVDTEGKAILIERIIEAVPQARTQALLACMTLIPLALLTAAYFVFRNKYKISEERYNEMTREIAEREQKEAVQAPPGNRSDFLSIVKAAVHCTAAFIHFTNIRI
ncbi:MAG: hypothetical protein LIO46_07380, partial [Clostridiales bacterium]|nr:hypothetical protein [Clostridiales bacterium]